MTITELLNDAKEQLLVSSSTPHLDAEFLLMRVLAVGRSYLYTHPEKKLTSQQLDFWYSMLQQRLSGRPMAYILGQQEFWSLNLKVTSDVLIPRSETELLVEIALQKLPRNEILNVADLGTGSGAIALALAHERPHWRVFATDLSAEALILAKENAANLKIENIDFFCGDWCCALPEMKYDAIVANPPYIAISDQNVAASVRQFEPHAALFSKEDGLEAIRLIAGQARSILRVGGWLFLEHGFLQGTAVVEILQGFGYRDVCDHLDLAGHGRVVKGMLL